MSGENDHPIHLHAGKIVRGLAERAGDDHPITHQEGHLKVAPMEAPLGRGHTIHEGSNLPTVGFSLKVDRRGGRYPRLGCVFPPAETVPTDHPATHRIVTPSGTPPTAHIVRSPETGVMSVAIHRGAPAVEDRPADLGNRNRPYAGASAGGSSSPASPSCRTADGG